MFWFCKRKTIDVHLFTTRKQIFDFAKPKKAIEYLPEWFKKLPTNNFTNQPNQDLFGTPTIKSCPGFIDLYKTGFVFPLWSDLNIEIREDGFRYQFADHYSQIDEHGKTQIDGCHFNFGYYQTKLLNPWALKTNKNVNLMFTAPSWNNFGHGDIVVAPGIISAQPFLTPTNINLFFKQKPELFIYELKYGTPLVHVVPVTEDKIKLHYELISEEELQKLWRENPMFLMFKKRFRRAEKICPHV